MIYLDIKTLSFETVCVGVFGADKNETESTLSCS